MLYKLKVNFLARMFAIASKIFGVGFPPAPSVSAIIERKGKILVINLSYKDGYALPGGVLKGEESFEEALRREIKEETGLSIVSSEYFGTYSSGADVGDFPKVNVTYKTKVKGRKRDSKEGECVWKKPGDIINEFVYKDNQVAVKDYLK